MLHKCDRKSMLNKYDLWLNCCEQIMFIFLESGAYEIFLYIQSFFHGTVTMLRSARPCSTLHSGRSMIFQTGASTLDAGVGGVCSNLLFAEIFAFSKNCMKIKEIGPRLRRLPRNPAKFALWFFIYNYDLQWKMCNLFCLYSLCM